jgi:Leucine-rich repeat (LRR) protein
MGTNICNIVEKFEFYLLWFFIWVLLFQYMSYIEYQTIDGKIHTDNYDDIKEITLSCDVEKIIKTNGLINLQKLSLRYNQLKRIDGLDRLVNLRELCSFCNLIDRIDGLNNLTNLQDLNLFCNRIKRIDGLDRLTNLRKLNLSDNQIERIEGLDRLIGLRELNLSNNQIERIEGLDRLIGLQELRLDNNRITKIENLDRLTDLRKLYLGNNQMERVKGLENQIKQIEGLDRLNNLRELHLENNRVERIEGLDRLNDLRELHLDNNLVERMEGLDQLTNLQKLYLGNNLIKRIERLDRLNALRTLCLLDNRIDEIPMSIMYLRNICYLNVDIPINPIIGRFLLKNLIKSDKTIYDDPQNVHDSQINRSITDSLYRLMEEKSVMSEDLVVREIIDDAILTESVKRQIVEYIKIPDVHSSLNVTFSEALRTVWQIIRQHKEVDEIKKILDQEMQDSICRCFTGRLSRLINCLNGFDPRVSIKISDQQEIANLIVAIRQQTDNLDQQIVRVKKELTERGFSKQTIDEWLGYLE